MTLPRLEALVSYWRGDEPAASTSAKRDASLDAFLRMPGGKKQPGFEKAYSMPEGPTR